jgi:hypothetical protein
LCERLLKATEVDIGRDVGYNRPQGCGINSDIEVAEKCEWPATTTVVTVRREQWMIEQIVNVRTKRRGYALAKVEGLVYS